MKNNMYLKQYVYRLVHFLPTMIVIGVLQLVGCLIWMYKSTRVEYDFDMYYNIISLASAILMFVSIFNIRQDKLCDSIFNNGKVFAVTNTMLLLTISFFVSFVNMLVMPTMKILLSLLGGNITIVEMGYFIPSFKAIVIEFSLLFLVVFALGEMVIFANRLVRKFFVFTLVFIGVMLFLVFAYSSKIYSSEFFAYICKHIYLLYLLLIGIDIVLFVPSFLITYFKEN